MLKRLTNLFKPKLVILENENKRINPEDFLRQLEWTTLRKLDGQLQGDYRTWFKGSGLELADLREYQTHDDVRHIDWNVTARMQTPYVREHQEDREMTTWFLIDLSRSLNFGSAEHTKKNLASSFTGVFARLMTRRGNRVGAILFTGASAKIDALLPAKTGKAHVLQILDLLLNTQSLTNSPATDLKVLLQSAQALLKKRSTIFVISDFISQPDWEKSLGELNKSHDVIAVRLCDPLETQLKNIGLFIMEDSETAEQMMIDTNDPFFQKKYAQLTQEHADYLTKTFQNTGTDCIELYTDEPIHESILRFSKLRKRQSQRRPPNHFATI